MKLRPPQNFSRNTFLFMGGLAGVFHETVLTSTERPTLLILFAAMMGLPAFLGEKKDSEDDDSDESK